MAVVALDAGGIDYIDCYIFSIHFFSFVSQIVESVLDLSTFSFVHPAGPTFLKPLIAMHIALWAVQCLILSTSLAVKFENTG